MYLEQLDVFRQISLTKSNHLKQKIDLKGFLYAYPVSVACKIGKICVRKAIGNFKADEMQKSIIYFCWLAYLVLKAFRVCVCR